MRPDGIVWISGRLVPPIATHSIAQLCIFTRIYWHELWFKLNVEIIIKIQEMIEIYTNCVQVKWPGYDEPFHLFIKISLEIAVRKSPVEKSYNRWRWLLRVVHFLYATWGKTSEPELLMMTWSHIIIIFGGLQVKVTWQRVKVTCRPNRITSINSLFPPSNRLVERQSRQRKRVKHGRCHCLPHPPLTVPRVESLR